MDNLLNTVNNMSRITETYIKPIRNYSLADWKYECLIEQIQEFQNNLTDDLDVCVQFASFGQTVFMLVDNIGYQNPDMLFFYGTVNGRSAQLIQHVSQLNFLLLAQPKDNPEEKPRRIGFCLPTEDADELEKDE